MKSLSNMTGSKRLYLIFWLAIGVLIVALVVGTYGINHLLSARADTLSNLKAKSQALTQEQTSFTIAKQDIHKYSGLQKIAQAVVPEDKDQAEAVREIVNIASANDVSLSSITFPASSLGVSPTGASSSSSSTATTPSQAANSRLSALSQLQPVPKIPGVYSLAISIQSDTAQPVQYNKFVNFLSALEHNRRTAQVSTITLAPTVKDPNLVTFSLTLNEYIKP